MKCLQCILIAFLLMASGCANVQQTVADNEPKAQAVADWVKTRSGFIENAVAAITQVAVYATDKDTIERTNTLLLFHTLSSNLNALVDSGKVDAESIRNALKVDELYFTPIVNAIAPLIQGEINTFRENGYADACVEILKAVTKGISDGSASA